MELRRRFGYLLMLVILLGAALMFLATALLGFVDGNRQLAFRLEREWIAEAAAQAGLERARWELARNPDWQQGFPDLVEPQSQGHCLLTFQAGKAPHSTSNVRGSAAVQGFAGRVVPPGFVHLVATGYQGPHTFVAEALVCVTGDLLYSDFEHDAAGWKTALGRQFAVTNGTWQVGGPETHSALAGHPGWRDYTLEVRARQVSGAQTLALTARAPWGTSGTGLDFRYDPRSDSFSLQGASVERTQTPLATLKPRWWGDFHLYSLSVVGDQAVAKVDAKVVLSASVPAATVQGRVGLGTGPGTVWAIDEVRVTSPQRVHYTARW